MPQALTDIHLYSNLEGEIGQNASISTIYIVLSIALLILLNACANYVNLSTAQSWKRAKEVGIRKTFGSARKQLILQFLGETFLITVLSFLFSLIIVETILPFFNSYFNQELTTDLSFDPIILLIFLGILIVTSCLAGLYPAFKLTSFSASEVLKGKMNLNNQLSFTLGRKGMIVFQFFVSTILIVSSLAILKQLQFIQQKDLGYDEENLIIIPLSANGERKGFEPLKDKLLSNPNIYGVTSAVNYPGRGFIDMQHWLPGETQGEFAQMGFVGSNFLDVFGINLIEGKDFYENNIEGNQQAVIVNETAVTRLGLGENPIGKIITRTDPRADQRAMYEIIGVMEDFNTESLREEVQPVILYIAGFTYSMVVRIAPDQSGKTLDFMRDSFQEVNPNSTFEYRFLDDYLSEYYRADENFLRIVTSFTLLAVFIAGMGLLGLVGYFIQSRTKELAIRKVLGASVSNIMALLSRDFVLLVVIGFVIAVPVAWYAMNLWLADFAYKIDIGVDVFVLAGGAALLIAILTVSWQSIKAAFANPVDSLRSE